MRCKFNTLCHSFYMIECLWELSSRLSVAIRWINVMRFQTSCVSAFNPFLIWRPWLKSRCFSAKRFLGKTGKSHPSSCALITPGEICWEQNHGRSGAFRTRLGLNSPERFGKLSVRARQAVYKAVTGTSGARKILEHFWACGTVISYTSVFQYIHDK